MTARAFCCLLFLCIYNSGVRSRQGPGHDTGNTGHHAYIGHQSSGSRGSKGPSLDRQITVQDVECLREAFALFDPDKKDTITPEKLGKVCTESNIKR